MPNPRTRLVRLALQLLIIAGAVSPAIPGPSRDDAPLPRGVKAVWNGARAWRETTPTRERICLNGLWRFKPALPGESRVPAGGYGFLKVPGSWPGVTDWLMKDSQTLHRHASFEKADLRALSAAFCQRSIDVPAGFDGRRVALRVEYLNSFATVFIDGTRIGEIRFPGGEIDLTNAVRQGRTHELTLLVEAWPLRGVILSYGDTNAAREVKGTVARRGLCGDLFLESTPDPARITDVRISTSVRGGRIGIDAAIEGVGGGARHVLSARVTDGRRVVAEFKSPPFRVADLAGGRLSLEGDLAPERLWDTHTPGNLLTLELSLETPKGELVDAAFPVRFGFREFRIEGHDFVLNGKRIHLIAVPLDLAQIGAALATRDAARESLLRLKAMGVNFVYTHNYGCEPGSHLGFTEILDAADETGMLVAFSMPHFGHYDWTAPDADGKNGYADHAAFYVRAARNHPSVVAFAMSHNATGYEEDMNPDLMDGVSEPRSEWSKRGAVLARRAEAIVARLDPDRVIYHHSSGNLGALHTVNFYANFAPAQELSDWFSHWAAVGRKPLFLCEYGSPLSWDFTMYRGWYQGKRAFGSAQVPWEFCLAEWSAQVKGDRAFELSEREKANLRWEAAQYAAGRTWHRWDYPTEVGSNLLSERDEVYAGYIAANWRAFRTHGLSAFCPWDHGHWFRPRDGVDRSRRELPTDWEDLQRPGFSPDFVGERYERVDLAFERADWLPTAAGEAFLRNSRPLLAFIGGKPGGLTERCHTFLAGETAEKAVVVINDSREPVSARCEISIEGLRPDPPVVELTVPPGDRALAPVKVAIPADLPAGRRELVLSVHFDTGEEQMDTQAIDVLPLPPAVPAGTKTALFDPRGDTAKLLDRHGVVCREVKAGADLAGFDILVVGRGALTAEGPGPDLSRVREGLRVLVFEQTAEALEKRLGLRVAEYGLRNVFVRVPGHPLLTGVDPAWLSDWRGEATLLPPRLEYESRAGTGPVVNWCGIPVTRLWRCGNRGNVASVLIEKPARGDFLPVLDGGFGLQYTPLAEVREGKGFVLFCQLDVTGRTVTEPAADHLVRNCLRRVAEFEPAPGRRVAYAGEPAGLEHLERAGFAPRALPRGGRLAPEELLVLGPGAGATAGPDRAKIASWLAKDGRILAVGLGAEEAGALLPVRLATRRVEHIGAFFPPPPPASLLAGIGPADVMNHDPRELNLVTGGAAVVGNGVLAADGDRGIVFCQLVPWHFDPAKSPNLKRTFRRSSALLGRLLANLGAAAETPLLARFAAPASPGEKRWLEGLYLDEPAEWDDPYRFFRW
jgi:hypothetical protein